MADYRSNVWKLYAFRFLKSMYFFSGVLIPFFTVWGGISFFQVMILQSWFALWQMVLEVPTGAVADFFGRKASISIGVLVHMAAVIVYASKPSFYVFLLGEFLWALAFALISGADVALMYDTLKEEKEEKQSKKILGRYDSFELLAIIIAAPAGSLIAKYLGVQYSVLLMALPFFGAFLISLTVKEPPYREKKDSTRYITQLTSGIKYFYRHKTLRILASDYIFVFVLSFFIFWLYQPLLMQLNLDLAYFGVVHAGATLFEMVILNSFGFFEKRLKSKKTYAYLSAVLTGISFILLSFSSSVVLTIILIFLVFGFGITRRVLFVNYMNKYIESDKRATVLSSINMFQTLGRALFYPVVGIFTDNYLNLVALAIGGLILVTSTLSRVEEHMLID